MLCCMDAEESLGMSEKSVYENDDDDDDDDVKEPIRN